MDEWVFLKLLFPNQYNPRNQTFVSMWPHLSDSPENLLLMRVHLCESTNLSKVDVFPVTERYDLIKGEDEVETVLWNFTLLQNSTVLWDLKQKDESQILLFSLLKTSAVSCVLI